MDAALQFELTVTALIFSVAALFFSLLAAFPGLKDVLAAVRDGVLWFALFLVLGGLGFVGWQHFQELPKPATASGGKVGPASSLPHSSISTPPHFRAPTSPAP
jgi:hypothetical protein